MSIKDLPRTNGRVIVPFGLGTMSRSSSAWNPDSGQAVRNNVPRLTNGRIPVFKFKPKVFDTFPEPTSFMDYDSTGPNAKYWAGSGGRQEDFEANYPEFTKVALGTSFAGKPIDGYRLGPVSGKHFVLVHGIHGNEVDGLDGGVRGIEILARDPLFQNFRDEWTIFFIPTLNPDGWFNGLRNLQEVGPNGRTINLNRQFDWFWDEYVETSFESKGATALSTNEAQALENYRATVETAGGRFGALMDFHANQGVGARYQTRDRIYREVLYGPDGGGEVPDNFLTIPLDFYTWQIHRSFATARSIANPGAIGTGLFVRYFRSRFRPHLHSYYSSLGVFSFAIEEVKVAVAGGRETVASACNYRLDYTLAVAAAITTDNWEFKDSILVEEATENVVLNNADWTDWQDDSRVSAPSVPEERPSFYTLQRSTVDRITTKEGKSHFQGGEAVRLISDLDINLSTPAEFNSATNDGFNSIAVVTSYGNVLSIPAERFKSGDLFSSPLSVHTTPVAAAVASAPATPYLGGNPTTPTKAIDVLGGGTAAFTGASALVTRIYTDEADGATPEEVAIVPTGWTARMHAGFADNFLAFPAAGGERGYVIGGQDAAAAKLTSMGVWNPSTTTFTTLTSVLSTGTIGITAVFNPNDGLVYLFGGETGVGKVTTIQTLDPVFDSLVDISGTVFLPKALAHMAGAFHPGMGKIFLYGGEEASGDMNDEIYEFDPVNLTITTIEVVENLDDDENVEVDGEEGAPWARKFGRWTAATLVEDAVDGGIIEIIGGRNKDSGIPIDTLVDTVYEHEADENTFGLASQASHGYIRFSSAIRREFVTSSTGVVRGLQVEEDFAAALGVEWIDPSINWTIGGGVATTTTSGPLILTTAPNYNNERLECDVRKTGGGAIGDFGLVVRASYTGATLDSGYRLRNDGSTDWFVERIVGGVATTVDTVTVGASEQITTSARTVQFTVTGRDPVQYEAIMNGTSILSGYDLEEDRIVDIGTTAVEGASSTDDIEIDNFKLLTSGQNELKYTASIFAKAAPDNASGYVRSTFYAKDDTLTNQFVTRRVRNYYTLPPKILYNWYHSRIDLRDGTQNDQEDGIRYYMRLYKDAQKVLLDGLHVQEGTLLTSSYQHPSTPRSKEIFTFPNAVNLNTFRVEFCWLTTTNFADLDEDLEIARIAIDSQNYISLVAKAGVGNGRFEREYNINDVHGPHDPVFHLEKCIAAATTIGEDVVCYWGYDMRDPSAERQDDVVKFTITHVAGSFWELKVERYGNEGRSTSSNNLAAFADTYASIVYRGIGYYSKPEIVDLSVLPNGRRVPTGRRGLIDRVRSLRRPQVFDGDRDPTGGQIVRDFPFIEGDDFDRANSSSIGSDWEDSAIGPYYQTGAGFNIDTNRAVCTDEGFQRWDRRTQHADIIMTADVTVDNDTDLVGLLARWDTDLRDTGLSVNGVTAYGAELRQITASSAEVRIVRWHRGTRVVLADTGLSSYTAGETLELKLTLSGSSLTAEVTGRGIANATDTNYKRPKRIGIYGQTGGAAQEVSIDNFNVAQNFDSGVE